MMISSGSVKTNSFSLKHILWIGLAILFTLTFYILKYQSPQWIESLYASGELSAWNESLKIPNDRGLNYYLGKYEDFLFGPLCQVMSGVLFALLALRYLKDVSLVRFALAVFVYLVLTKLEVLSFPPYGDAIGGPFMEALWLAKNKFDYVGLFHQPSYADGGPRVYMFSIYPTYLAFWMTIFPSLKIFLAVNHLLVFLIVAVIIAVFRQIIRQIYPADLAILGALILLYVPVFQTQTEAINMELPCLIFVIFSAYHAVNKNLPRATVFAILATLTKGTGVLACATIFVLSIILFFWDKTYRSNKRILFHAALLILLAFLAVWSKFFMYDQHVRTGGISLFRGWESIAYRDLYLHTFVVSIPIFLLYNLWSWWVHKRKKLAYSFLKQHYLALVMSLFGLMWILLILNFPSGAHRYRVILYPFSLFFVFYVVSLLIPSHRMRKLGLIVFMILVLLNSYGFYTHNYSATNHVLLEYSLEYRNDLKLNQLLSKTLEEKYSHLSIGAPFMLAHILAFPELGYVKRPLNVMIYGFPSNYKAIKNYPGLHQLDIKKTIYLTKLDEMRNELSYPLSTQDMVIETLEFATKKAFIFVGGIGIERAWRNIQLLKLQQRL